MPARNNVLTAEDVGETGGTGMSTLSLTEVGSTIRVGARTGSAGATVALVKSGVNSGANSARGLFNVSSTVSWSPTESGSALTGTSRATAAANAELTVV